MSVGLPVKLSAYSCGTMPNPNGDLVRVNDLAEHLEHVLDNEDYVRERIRDLIEHCRSSRVPDAPVEGKS